jgi:hypothetical protein
VPELTPPTLDYRHQPPTPVSAVRFGRGATVLLTANTLLGGAMMLSVLYADRLGHATWLMVAAGACMVYTSMGCLSRDVPRFQLALGLATASLVMMAIATILNFMHAQQLEAQILSRATPGSVVYVDVRSGKGGELSTLWLAWKLCAVAALINLALVAYLTVRLGVIFQTRQRNA